VPKLTISPSSGSVEDSKKIKFGLEGITINQDTRVRIENATHRLPLDSIGSTIDLRIPEHSSHASISVYATIEQKQDSGGYAIDNILSAVYSVTNEKPEFNKAKIDISPSFIGPDEQALLSIHGQPSSRLVASVNDKQYSILTNHEGIGTITISANDVIDESDIKVVQKFPIEILSADDHYTKKKFSGSYVNVLPDKVAFYASCDPASAHPDCIDMIADETVGAVSQTLPRATDNIPSIGLNLDNDNNSCADINIIPASLDLCRVNTFDNILLPNGLFLTAVVSPDKEDDNKENRVFLVSDSSSLTAAALGQKPFAQRFAVILPTETASGETDLVLEPEIFDLVEVGHKILVLHESLDFSAYTVAKKKGPISNRDSHKVTLANTPVVDGAVLCVPIVLIDPNCTPAINIDAIEKLPYIEDFFGNTVTAINVSIATNINETGTHAFAYIVAEGATARASQLFLYSIKFRIDDCNVSSETPETFGWHQLTFRGENKNPKITSDSAGNLHVFWESDRSGLTQIYYGAVGPGQISAVNTAFSMALDNQAEVMRQGNPAWEIMSQRIVRDFASSVAADLNQAGDPVYENNVWLAATSNDGLVAVPDDATIRIAGKATEDQAIALAVLDRDEAGNAFHGGFQQQQYQIDFNLRDNNSLTVLEDNDIEELFETWLSDFAPTTSNLFKGRTVYEKDGNKFVIERDDRIYDRMIPVAGSYKKGDAKFKLNNGETTTNEILEAIFSGDSRNVNHFIVGLMPEKARFKATNIETFSEFCDSQGLSPANVDCMNKYIFDDEQVIYTGRYQVAVAMAALNDYAGSPRSDTFAVIRKVAEPFTLTDVKRNFKIIAHYNKMFDEDTRSWLGVEGGDSSFEETRFMASLWVVLDDNLVFAESFLTDLRDQYRKVDIGIGFPGGGGFITFNFLPYETSIYDSMEVDWTFEDVQVGGPTFYMDETVMTMPEDVRSQTPTILIQNEDLDPEDIADLYLEKRDLLKFGLDHISVNFPQIPITFEGSNQHLSLDIGKVCDDLHITWESNRSRFWDIYYANSVFRNLPFRWATQITNTETDSLSPDISVNIEGNRMILWHENLDGRFQIFAAKGQASPDICSINPNFAIDIDSNTGSSCPVLVPDTTDRSSGDPYVPIPCPPSAECEVTFEFCNGCCINYYALISSEEFGDTEFAIKE